MEELETIILVAAVILLLFIFAAALYIRIIRPFIETRAYIKMEMSRAPRSEYKYWRHELVRLYVYHIPIFGWLLVRLIK